MPSISDVLYPDSSIQTVGWSEALSPYILSSLFQVFLAFSCRQNGLCSGPISFHPLCYLFSFSQSLSWNARQLANIFLLATKQPFDHQYKSRRTVTMLLWQQRCPAILPLNDIRRQLSFTYCSTLPSSVSSPSIPSSRLHMCPALLYSIAVVLISLSSLCLLACLLITCR